MRIGIFGGTFDPVHLGHLILAEQCREQGRLEQVWFVPTAHPPHKSGRGLTPFAQRAEMLALAAAGQPAFHVENLEELRPGPSYTADTLDEIRRRQPAAELVLVLGSDALRDLPSWHEPDRIVRQAGLLVAVRPGYSLPDAGELRSSLDLPRSCPLRLEAVEMPMIDISSRELRARAALGRSLRYLVPRSVECYIDAHRLYTKAS
jgi:nicotinate-nucleotide adenylyltransferase